MNIHLTYYLSRIPVPGTVSIFIQKLMENNSRPGELCLTHKFCNEKALELLQKCTDKKIQPIMKDNLPALQSGVVWADLNFKSVNHFFNPLTKKGLWKFPSAVYVFIFYLSKARQSAMRQDSFNTFFYLGAAAHILQDMTVPHHACGCLFSGHKKFENWVQAHLNDFSFLTCDTWPSCRNPIRLILSNAKTAAVFMPLVSDISTEDEYYHSARILLLLAQTSSAALFEWFIETAVLPQAAAEEKLPSDAEKLLHHARLA